MTDTAIHVAAALDPATLTQHCARCGYALALPDVFRWEDWEYEMEVAINPSFKRESIRSPRRVFAAGDMVESCRYGLSLAIAPGAVPTCQRKAESQEAA